MKIEIVRKSERFKQGVLNINGRKFCDTFEIDSQLPVGVYQITAGKCAIYEGGEAGGVVLVPMVENVPKIGTVVFQDGEKYIRFEDGGVIGVCCYNPSTHTRMYGHSCLSALNRIFAKAWAKKESVELEIREEYGKS